MDHSKLPARDLTKTIISDFQLELDRYINMSPDRIKKITVDEAMNLAKLGHGIPTHMITEQKMCRGLLREFLNIGGSLQLREYIHCEQYIRFMTGNWPVN